MKARALELPPRADVASIAARGARLDAMTTTSIESSMSPASQSAMGALRAATRAEHAAIEAAVPLVAAGVTLDAYRRYLSRFLGFYEPVEAALASAEGLDAHLPDLPARSKRAHLTSDLLALALAPAEIAGLPRCARAPAVASVPAALGCAYVLEGSTLGGLILARHLRGALGAPVEGRLAFLTSYGADVGPMWRTFGRHVDAYAGKHPGAVAPMIESARATFTLFADWLRSGLAR
jgi:heme oxygenase